MSDCGGREVQRRHPVTSSWFRQRRSLSSQLIHSGVDVIGLAQIFKQRQQVKELRVVHIIEPRNHRNLRETTVSQPAGILTTAPASGTGGSGAQPSHSVWDSQRCWGGRCRRQESCPGSESCEGLCPDDSSPSRSNPGGIRKTLGTIWSGTRRTGPGGPSLGLHTDGGGLEGEDVSASHTKNDHHEDVKLF